MLRTILLLSCVLGALALPIAAQTINAVIAQPPLSGIVTFVEPRGQFYMNIGSEDQLYNGAQLRIVRHGTIIALARVIKVSRLDAIGQLLPQYQGLRLQTGDYTVVTANPIPFDQPRGLPAVEPDLSQREAETFFTLFFIFAIGSAIANE